MNATTTEPLVDILPARKGERVTLRWVPGALPGCGVAKLVSRRAEGCYAVATVPTDWPGVGLHFEKVAGGTDAAEDAYSVFVATDPRGGERCTCKGHSRWGHCKHADAGRALVGNGWL